MAHSQKLAGKESKAHHFCFTFPKKLFLLFKHYTKKILSPKYMHYSGNIYIYTYIRIYDIYISLTVQRKNKFHNGTIS